METSLCSEIHNAKCLGSWQFTVPHMPSTSVIYNATETQEKPFCYGGTSMYMDGFHRMDTVCLIYLFPEWVLNTEGKFVAAAIGSVIVGSILLEAIIMHRRMVMSSMGASYKYRRLAASAMFYGLRRRNRTRSRRVFTSVRPRSIKCQVSHSLQCMHSQEYNCLKAKSQVSHSVQCMYSEEYNCPKVIYPRPQFCKHASGS